MLKSLYIERFRAFPSLRLENLGTVNLIVGRNNVGKTMLLEALRVYTANDTLAALRTLLLERDEIVIGPSRAPDDDELELRISALFNGRKIVPGPSGEIKIGPRDDHEQTLRIAMLPLRRIVTTEPARAVSYQIVDITKEPEELGLLPGLTVNWGSATQRTLPFSYFAQTPRRWRSTLESPFPSAPSVSAKGIPERELAQWWDVVALRDGESRVTDCLRLISPVERLTMVEHPVRRGERIPMVKMEGIGEPVPLKSLGDGMLRLFHLALAAESSAALSREPSQLTLLPSVTRRTVTPPLLIDEVENGIHYAALQRLWRFLFEVAARHSIQIFATSHSWDCIESFQAAAANAGRSLDARLIRLEAKNDAKKAVVFANEELATVTRDRIEVR